MPRDELLGFLSFFSREKLQFFPIKLFIEGIFIYSLFLDIFLVENSESKFFMIKSTIFLGGYPQLIQDDGI